MGGSLKSEDEVMAYQQEEEDLKSLHKGVVRACRTKMLYSVSRYWLFLDTRCAILSVILIFSVFVFLAFVFHIFFQKSLCTD